MKSKIEVFHHDAQANAGYVYTTNNKLSSRMAMRKLADLVLGATSTKDRSVVDVGCGDGFFTEVFFTEGHPSSVMAVDPVPGAIAVAHKRRKGQSMHFLVADGHRLPWCRDTFDLAILNCVIHHDDDPRGIIREVLRLAPEVVLVEPNGNNLGLKVIEKTSRYHREHHERSFPSRRMRRWVEECGGTVVDMKFAGLVPFFCPDRIARLAKAMEPRVEGSKFLSFLGCAVYVMLIRRTN